MLLGLTKFVVVSIENAGMNVENQAWKRKLLRITALIFVMVGGLLLWILVITIFKNALGYSQSDVPSSEMFFIGVILLGFGIYWINPKKKKKK